MSISNYDVKPLFSVLMLTYNHQDYIAEAIMSIFNQKYKDFFELIILDDHSLDGTWNIVQSIVANIKLPHINIITVRHKKNIGSVENFNYGLSLSSGKIIVVADGDDISHKNRLDRLQELHFCHSKSLYISNARIIRQDLEFNSLKEKKFYNYFNLDNLSYRDLFTNKTPVFGASYAFDKMLFDKGFKIDPIWVTYNNVDQYIFWKAYLNQGIFYTDECLIDYRIHRMGLSINKSNGSSFRNKEKYILNRMGNALYLLQDIILREKSFLGQDSQFLLEKIKHDFSRLNLIVCEKSILDDISSDRIFWIKKGGKIIFNGVVIEGNIRSLKSLRVDELIFVLNFLFLSYDLDSDSILRLSNLCREGGITKNEIIFLFRVRGDQNNNLINLTFRDKMYLLWSVLSNRFRVLKMFHEIKK